jgi:hypothetical protein
MFYKQVFRLLIFVFQLMGEAIFEKNITYSENTATDLLPSYFPEKIPFRELFHLK